jgi:hypothetical protein
MTELSIPEKQFLRAFADAIGALNDSGFEMTPTTLQTFLLVAEDEGKSAAEYADRAGCNSLVMAMRLSGLQNGGLIVPGAGETTLTPEARELIVKVFQRISQGVAAGTSVWE